MASVGPEECPHCHNAPCVATDGAECPAFLAAMEADSFDDVYTGGPIHRDERRWVEEEHAADSWEDDPYDHRDYEADQ